MWLVRMRAQVLWPLWCVMSQQRTAAQMLIIIIIIRVGQRDATEHGRRERRCGYGIRALPSCGSVRVEVNPRSFFVFR
ncbi:hypothetical protein V8C40DRAFT_251312 [Trichoderma camerunense]